MAIEVDPGGGVDRPGRAPEHLTLEFLGEVPPERIPAIGAALGPIGAEVPPFDLTLEGVGAFPSRARPRVVWVGATHGREEVTELARRVASALAPLGLPAPRETFEPHLTLFRVRSERDRVRALDLLEARTPAPAARTVHVREIVLKESVLGPGGAVHRTIATVPLGGGGASVPR